MSLKESIPLYSFLNQSLSENAQYLHPSMNKHVQYFKFTAEMIEIMDI